VTRLYLIRHGETAWSKTGRHTGTTDLPLTAEGTAQAQRVAARLGDRRFARVLSSPLRRARETCLAAGWSASEIATDADLVEWHYGDYEALTSAEIRANRPGWNLFRDGCPGGESPDAVAARADRILARVRDIDGDVALCSHGHMGRVLGARWIGLPVASAQHLLLDTASLSVLGHEHGSGAPAIALWNVV
jgi:probable phosphoglycerate mutase